MSTLSKKNAERFAFLLGVESYKEQAMENATGIQSSLDTDSENRPVGGNKFTRTKTVEQLSILDWYRILRVQYHYPLFQAIRFALWLAR